MSSRFGSYSAESAEQNGLGPEVLISVLEEEQLIWKARVMRVENPDEWEHAEGVPDSLAVEGLVQVMS